jgi:hypothetical protein
MGTENVPGLLVYRFPYDTVCLSRTFNTRADTPVIPDTRRVLSAHQRSADKNRVVLSTLRKGMRMAITKAKKRHPWDEYVCHRVALTPFPSLDTISYFRNTCLSISSDMASGALPLRRALQAFPGQPPSMLHGKVCALYCGLLVRKGRSRRRMMRAITQPAADKSATCPSFVPVPSPLPCRRCRSCSPTEATSSQ